MTTETTQETVQHDITRNDLVQLQRIVEVAQQRGAFRANEMTVVGTTYNRLSAWLEQTKPVEAEAPAEATTETVEKTAEAQKQ